MTDIIAFIDANIKLNEKGKTWSLSKYQRVVLKLMFSRYFAIRLYSEVKKSGKTFLAACIAIYEAVTNPDCEIVCCANDEEQAISRVFQTACQLIKYNPELTSSATVYSTQIRFTNGSVIKAVASDYAGAAGGRQRLTVFDEIWAFSLERMRRLYEEMLPPPTEQGAYILIVTYAGFSGESELLESLYTRGMKGKRLSWRYEVYADAGLCMFWSHTPRQPWLDKIYYDEQRRTLRPNTFRRQHQNEWVSSESAFITGEQWDAVTENALTPLLPTKNYAITIGVDIGVKNDAGAVVAVRRDESGKVVVCFHRLWRPSFLQPVQLAEVEEFIKDTCQKYHVAKIAFDPSQAYQMLQNLKGCGLPAVEFPQTQKNTTAMATDLINLVTSRNIRTYPDKTLREHVTNAVAIENGNNVRMAKPTGSRKIDLAAALSIACVTILQGQITLDVDGFISMNRLMPERTMQGQDWGNAPASKYLDPMDVLLDQARMRRGGFWDT